MARGRCAGSAEGERKTEARSSPTRQAARFSKRRRCYEPHCSKLQKCYEPKGPKLNTRPLHGTMRDALGRRAREAVPDSQSASERGERAEGPESPREQGWRHLVVN